MSHGDFGYGSVSRPSRPSYMDNPGRQPAYRDDPGPFGAPNTVSGMRRYNEFVDVITSNIFKINNNATTLERAAKNVGTKKDSVDLRDRIHTTEQNTNRLIGETTQVFKQLSGLVSRSDRQQKLQYERLTNEFKESVQRYNTLQKGVAAQVKSAVLLSAPREPRTETLVSWQDEVTEEQRRQADDERRQQLQVQGDTIEADLSLLHDREERIVQLESDILDINEIFKELGTLVHEQGEVIDTIQDNVESAYGHVDEGNEQLIQASKYQRKARKKMCILVLILLVVGCVLALIIGLSLKH
ncbi:hypothetical protein NP493_169g00003 [Ridgeia piscesae]|uniref:t-SNARE coiled-coil homology domain-containing protein n=1 Tax=Ridgeia piscesae TaxID=27915 RepID=A0AAD9P378_RIDPI|nr:hypothetical protein NP493_169g00003 [Ridgeia piscesae]